MEDFSEDIERCLEVLHAGGIILYPTDTIWGLGCDATNEEAVKKLIAIKGKPESRGLIVLLSTERDVLQYVASPDMEVFDYLQQTIKPTTVIYQNGIGVADAVLHADGSIAIRLVGEDFCRHLLKRFKKPIVSTSANLHGQHSPQNFSAISSQVKMAVAYIVKHKQHVTGPEIASSIVRWQNGKVEVLR